MVAVGDGGGAHLACSLETFVAVGQLGEAAVTLRWVSALLARDGQLDVAESVHPTGPTAPVVIDVLERAADLAVLLARPGHEVPATELMRTAVDSTEKARSAVTRRIRDAIRRISDVHRELGDHLDAAVRTGRRCSYEPDHPSTWRVLEGNEARDDPR